MAEQDTHKEDLTRSSPAGGAGEELDAAGRSLSEALRISFVILKIIMGVLILIFLASGFRTVGPDERALVLRFGKIQGRGEKRLLKPGLHWIYPYPIEEIVKIPVEKKVNLAVNSFWYFQTQREMLGEDPTRRTRVPLTLDPLQEGYCLTRSEKQDLALAGSDGSDYSIIHCKWKLIYQIDDPELFFKNVYVEAVKPGQVYFDVMTGSIAPMLELLVEDAVVTVMVNYTIDDVMFERVATVTEHVKTLLQEKLDNVESGIKVVSVQLTDKIWPRQVDGAFQATVRASQEYEKVISEARTYAENALNEAAGIVAKQLFSALQDETMSDQEKEYLWSRLAGEARQQIAEARAYRTSVVETAKADAEYLRQILPEYRKRPKLVLQKIYLDTVEEVLNNIEEKMIIQPSRSKSTEIRIQLSKESLKPESTKEQAEQE